MRIKGLRFILAVAVIIAMAFGGVVLSEAASFTDNGNGTVTDNTTGLTWQQDEFKSFPFGIDKFNWYEASGTYDARNNPSSQSACGSLSLAGGGWRL